MILVDTSIIVAWLDRSHPDHVRCEEELFRWAGEDQLAVSAVTYAELAAGGRTREAVDEDLRTFKRLELDFEASWRAGLAFGGCYPGKKGARPVLPDFLIRAQAATLGCPHLTNDRRRLGSFPDVDFLFPATA
jgi:predicted nucleic acid-binding protein